MNGCRGAFEGQTREVELDIPNSPLGIKMLTEQLKRSLHCLKDNGHSAVQEHTTGRCSITTRTHRPINCDFYCRLSTHTTNRADKWPHRRVFVYFMSVIYYTTCFGATCLTPGVTTKHPTMLNVFNLYYLQIHTSIPCCYQHYLTLSSKFKYTHRINLLVTKTYLMIE
jgi:hypothetical protein